MTASETITEAKLEELTQWQPYIDDDLMYEIESDCQDHSHDVNRRILLATLTMDGEKLFEACEKEPDAFFDGFRCSASTLGMYKRLVRLLEVGHNRLMLGLCGVDFDQPDAPFSKQEFFDAIHEAKGEDDSDIARIFDEHLEDLGVEWLDEICPKTTKEAQAMAE